MGLHPIWSAEFCYFLLDAFYIRLPPSSFRAFLPCGSAMDKA